MGFSQYISNNRLGVMLALTIMVLGSAAYAWRFGLADATGGRVLAIGVGAMSNALPAGRSGLFDGLRLKMVWTPEGDGELVANARNNAMARFRASEGNPLPEADSMVLGADEAAAMRKEKEFSNIGDRAPLAPGMELAVGGVLEKTGSFLDMAHFVDAGTYERIKGDDERPFVELSDSDTPVLFYRLDPSELGSTRLAFAQGKPVDYVVHELGGGKYYPLVLGADEAKAMRDGKMFATTGDTIKGFFGRNVFVAGVLDKTGTPLDAMIFSPLGEKELQ
ncbi:MAG: hypothetical protein V1728_04540 [Candidatus Micrarchaeota archaeon]